MDININKSLGEKIVYFSMATMILFGGFMPNTVEAKTSEDITVAEPKHEPIKDENVDMPGEPEVLTTQTEEKGKIEKVHKSEEKSQPNKKSIEKEKTDFKTLKDMKVGDEFSFGGRVWVLISPANGYAMMKEKVTDIKLENADFDKGNANEILQYFDSIYYNELSKNDAALMESERFGLTKFEEGLHVAVKFKAVAGLTKEGSMSLQDVTKAIKETNKKTPEKGDKNFGLIATGSLIILVGIIVTIQAFVRRNKKKQNH